MKAYDKITVMMMMGILLSLPMAYATGPGFEKDVYTWGNNNGNDDDNHGGGDDDGHWGNDDHCDDDWNDDDNYEVPLDGGLGFLAAAGAAYGIKRIRDNRKKEK